ncbi:OmpH family outer membrane protein [Spirochaeta africana]|uniref:Outer membrane protein n=1 Tax=Spirochaeta africana (strain ATCC 700263 / DSM 8902 / Z-7692) TaxID=889378 RepID=H9UJB1_SPIAZ|nr:OmpH family outer membrane protein [Spirochaeta africana]AFG37604.1 outer membrane protein [Spirochaeta africana DSM 8902]
MNKIRTIGLLGVFLLAVSMPAAAEQLTTVAILDVSRVYSSFLRDSQAVRNLERAAEEARTEIRRHEQELVQLREQRVEARDNDNNRRVLELDEEIQEKQQFIEELRRVRSSQLERQQRDLMSSDAFLNEIQQAVRFVSESQGYTVVLNAADPNLQWWASEVDITDRVIERLRQTRR